MRKAILVVCLLLATVLFAPSAQCAKSSGVDMSITLEEHLTALTQTSRGAGTSGEKRAASYLAIEFQKYGYEVTQQTFPVQIGLLSYESTNVIAAHKAKKNPDTAPILIISSNLDSKPVTFGANDNASGMAVMQEVARLTAGLKPNVELRFIAFGAKEDGLYGSSYYISSLTEDEKSRIIGVIQLDMLGNRQSTGFYLGTANGEITLLSQMLDQASKALDDTALPRMVETGSDHTSFVRNGIPAVLLQQNGDSFENHTLLDDMTMIDVDKLAEAAQLVLNVTLQVAGGQPDTLLRQSREMTDFSNFYALAQARSSLDFGQSRRQIENKIGITSEFVGTQKDESGANIETYRYLIKWFRMERPIPTLFHYRNGILDRIEIESQQNGYNAQRMLTFMTADLGQAVMGGNMHEGVSYRWDLWLYRKCYELIDRGDTYTLCVYNLYDGERYEKVYSLIEGALPAGVIIEESHKKIWEELITKIFRTKDLAMVRDLSFYSDGMNFTMTKTSPAVYDDNTALTLMVDTQDVLDENGNYRNFDRSAASLVHEYGHILSLNSAQVTLGVAGDIPVYYSQCNYAPESYIRKFFETFCVGMTSDRYGSLYLTHPEYFVSSNASDDVANDFADSFMVFVLGPKRQGDTLAEQKVNFFYEFDEMVEIRDFIRKNLRL